MAENRFDTFMLAGELKDGKDCFYEYCKVQNEGCVYALLIGDEFYIGSTTGSIRWRIADHFRELRLCTHKNPKVQKAYDKTGWCKAYIIFRTHGKGYQLMENMLIVLMQPTLNIREKDLVRREVSEAVWSMTPVTRVFDGNTMPAISAIERIGKEAARLRELIEQSKKQRAKDFADYKKG